ncbi:MAG: SRPBCC domain-containing protein [Gammaproteobacteria bacterium]
MNIEAANMATVSMKIDIEAPAAKVWEALTSDIGKWWPADFYAGGEDGSRGFVLEQQPGGRMYEQWDNGGGVLWGNVVGLNPGKKLEVLGSVFPSFGGPTQWFGTWDLVAKSDKLTELRFSEVSLGNVSESGTHEKDTGWRYLWSCMHAFIDGRPAPVWE